MNWFDYPLVALACTLFGVLGFLAGALLVVKAFVDMHNVSLPPARRSTSMFSRQNLTPGAALARGYVVLAGIAAALGVAVGRGLP